jgi:hypothetical protein
MCALGMVVASSPTYPKHTGQCGCCKLAYLSQTHCTCALHCAAPSHMMLRCRCFTVR